MPSQTKLPSIVELWKATKQYSDSTHLWRAFWLGPANEKQAFTLVEHVLPAQSLAETGGVKTQVKPYNCQQGLDDIYEGVTKVQGNYAVLFIANVGNGDVRVLDRKLFFNSLRPHVYNNITKEVTFQSGVTLNVRNIIDRSGSIKVPTQLSLKYQNSRHGTAAMTILTMLSKNAQNEIYGGVPFYHQTILISIVKYFYAIPQGVRWPSPSGIIIGLVKSG
jgi:hypothetical protein